MSTPLTLQKAITHRSLLICSIGAGLICAALHYIRLPLPGTPVPIIVQPLGAFICGITLGPWYSLLSQMIYLFLLPFTAWHSLGGIAMLWGPTAGYMWGIVISSGIVGLLHKKRSFFSQTTLFLTITVSCIHIPGMMVLRTWHSFAGLPTPHWSSLLVQGMLPFLLGDTLKALISTFVARKKQ